MSAMTCNWWLYAVIIGLVLVLMHELERKDARADVVEGVE